MVKPIKSKKSFSEIYVTDMKEYFAGKKAALGIKKITLGVPTPREEADHEDLFFNDELKQYAPHTKNQYVREVKIDGESKGYVAATMSVNETERKIVPKKYQLDQIFTHLIPLDMIEEEF